MSTDDRDADERELRDEPLDPLEYDELTRLERLESLEEDMEELGVTNLEQVRAQIAELHRTLDEREGS